MSQVREYADVLTEGGVSRVLLRLSDGGCSTWAEFTGPGAEERAEALAAVAEANWHMFKARAEVAAAARIGLLLEGSVRARLAAALEQEEERREERERHLYRLACLNGPLGSAGPAVLSPDGGECPSEAIHRGLGDYMDILEEVTQRARSVVSVVVNPETDAETCQAAGWAMSEALQDEALVAGQLLELIGIAAPTCETGTPAWRVDYGRLLMQARAAAEGSGTVPAPAPGHSPEHN